MKPTKIFLLSSIAFFIVACGESTTENVTQINEMGMDVVKSVKDLPKCTKDNEGEMAFVKGETSARICVDGKWFATVASDSSTGMTCTTKALKDKSGVKIICGGILWVSCSMARMVLMERMVRPARMACRVNQAQPVKMVKMV